MGVRRSNSINEYVRRLYPEMEIENFHLYHNFVVKIRLRAQARGMDPSNLTWEQFNALLDVKDLHRGEKVHMKWEDSPVAKALIQEGIDYLDYKSNDDVVDNVAYWLIVPSVVKMAAKGIKTNNQWLINASGLSSEYIDKLKAKINQNTLYIS